MPLHCHDVHHGQQLTYASRDGSLPYIARILPHGHNMMPRVSLLTPRRANGHPKMRGRGSCLNPFHYFPASGRAWSVLLSVLEEGLRTVCPGNPTIEELLRQRQRPPPDAPDALLGEAAERDRTIFETLCRFLRSMPVVSDLDGLLCSAVSSVPGAQPQKLEGAAPTPRLKAVPAQRRNPAPEVGPLPAAGLTGPVDAYYSHTAPHVAPLPGPMPGMFMYSAPRWMGLPGPAGPPMAPLMMMAPGAGRGSRPQPGAGNPLGFS
jgi:hypothetical protein